MSEIFDIGIIGCGPAGYTAAFQARKKGLNVILFEKDEVGGVCLNKGCIPTKTILHSAEILIQAQKSGLLPDDFAVNFSSIMERKTAVVEKLRKGLENSLKIAKVNLVKANATVKDSNHIEADGKIYECGRIFIATGAEPKELPHIKFDGKFVLSSDDILQLQELPKSILIIGSGAIGLEWSQIFSAFGVDVTLVEVAKNLLPIADVEVSKRIERIFKTKNIKFFTETSVEKIVDEKVYLSNGEILQPEKVLMAVGRNVPEFEKIAGVEYLGDMKGIIQLAHYAIKGAMKSISNIHFDETLVPSVVYGTPEIAWVGKREIDLEPNSYQKSMVLIASLGKSHCDNATEGFIKILTQNGLIVGGHIISKEASALIHQILIAIQNKIPAEKLKEVCFAHPTYSEGFFDTLWL